MARLLERSLKRVPEFKTPIYWEGFGLLKFWLFARVFVKWHYFDQTPSSVEQRGSISDRLLLLLNNIS